MRIVYKRSLLFIAILTFIIALIGIGYLFYDKVIRPETLVVVNDELSINYLDGATIINNGEYHFSITNNGNSDVYFKIYLTEISGMSKDVSYILTSTNKDITSEEKKLVDGSNIVIENVLIKSMETQDYILKVSNNTNTTFKIAVDKQINVEEYFYMTILNNNELKKATTTVGEEISTVDEGLIESSDDDGTTYYFRGAVENNYVSFAGLTWRIIRINGDGSVRLILNDLAEPLVNYNDNMENYETLNATNLYNSLTNYYNDTLLNYDSSIANTKFCSESGKTDNTYNAYTRIVTNKIPTLHCLGERFTNKIGIISVDEVIFAGGLYKEENKNYYLYNSEIENMWWTSNLAKMDNDAFYPFTIASNGQISDEISGTLYRNFRPVISLNRTTTVTGDGTSTNPYVVK